MTTEILPAPARPPARSSVPAVRFVVVGALSTVAYLALYTVLRLWLPAQIANAVALLVTGDVNTSLNRRWSFGLAGPARGRERVKGIASYLVSLVATSAALALLDAIGAHSKAAELLALLVANALAGVAHYVLLRSWAFRQGAAGST